MSTAWLVTSNAILSAVACCHLKACSDCAAKQSTVVTQGAPPIAADPGGFSDFWIFRKMLILEIFGLDLGSGRVCNRLEMAVGFKWTDSQPISSLLSPFSTSFMILVILESFPVV